MSGFMSTCTSILWTWTGRAKKLDQVQFSIPPGWKQRMIRNQGPWRGKQNTPRWDRRHRHKLRETWQNVPESKMKELSKAASLYQSLPQGDSYNTGRMPASGHSFSLYGPTLSRQITYLFFPAMKLAYKWVYTILSLTWLTCSLRTIVKNLTCERASNLDTRLRKMY